MLPVSLRIRSNHEMDVHEQVVQSARGSVMNSFLSLLSFLAVVVMMNLHPFILFLEYCDFI